MTPRKVWRRFVAVLEDVETRHVITNKIMWKRTDFLKHVVREME